MSSPLPQDPFLDTDVQEPLSPTPPIPPVPLRSPARPTSPLIYGLPKPGSLRNPSMKPANITSTTPDAISSTPVAKAQSCSNDAKSVMALLMSRANNEASTIVGKDNITNLGRSGESSLTGSTTLVGDAATLTPIDPRGYDVKNPLTSTTTNTYQIPLQQTRTTDHLSTSLNPKNATKRYRLSTKCPEEVCILSSSAPTRINQAACYAPRESSKEACALPSKTLTISERPGRIYKEENARETAYLQNQLLEYEREKTAERLCEVPKLYSSPRRRPGSTFAGRENRDSDQRHAILGAVRSSSFWIFFFLIQIGMISTGAAFGVLLRDKGAGQSVRIGSGMLFWLICSIAASIIGIIGTICVCGSQCNGFAAAVRRTGLDEMGLMPKVTKSENGVTHGIKLRVEEDRKISPQLARKRQAKEEHVAGNTSMISISSLDPMWQPLYTTPEELRAKIMKESNQHDQLPNEIELRTAEYPKEKVSIGADTMLSGGRDLRMFNESDIGMQSLSPMPAQSPTIDHIKFKSPFARTRQEIDSRFPFSKLHSPAHQTMTRNAYKADKSTTSHISSHQASNKLQLEDETSPQSLSSFNSLYTQTTPSKTKAISGRTKESLKCNPLSSDRDHAPNLNNGTTPLSTLSPLESLTQDLNRPELRRLDIKDRHEYIISRRSIHKERGRKVRQSLERIPLAKSFGNQSGGGMEVVGDGPKGIEENKFESMSKMRAARPIVQEIVRGIETRSLSQTGEREGVAQSVRSTGSGKSPTSDEDGRESKVKKLVRERFYASRDVRDKGFRDGHPYVKTL